MPSDEPPGQDTPDPSHHRPDADPMILPVMLAPIAASDLANPPARPLVLTPELEGRLHPLTLLFAGWNAVRGFLIPVIALFLFGKPTVAGVLLLFPLAITVFIGMVRYFTFWYRIEGRELVTRQGILERTERHIPLERVQDIRIEQGPLHRILGVADVYVETAGGKGPEASFSVLSRREADRLRCTVFEPAMATATPVSGEAVAVPASAPASPILVRKLRTRELVLAGLTSNRMASALVAFAVIWGLADNVLPDDVYERIGKWAFRVAEFVMEQETGQAVLLVSVGCIFVLLFCTCFSVVGSVVLFHGFTLSRIAEDLHRSYGLLTHRSSSLPRRRIQVLEIEEGFLRRMFGLATLRADTAGAGADERGQSRGGRDVLLPIVYQSEVAGLVPVFLPDLDSSDPAWRRVSRKAIRRGTIKGAFLCGLFAAGAILFHRSWIGLWPILLLPAVYAVNVMQYNHLGYSLVERYFRTRRGWLSRSTHVVPIRNTQAIVLRETPFDRRLGLATLFVDSAGQTYTGGGPRITNLPADEARDLARSLAHQASQTRYRW